MCLLADNLILIANYFKINKFYRHPVTVFTLYAYLL